MTKQRRPIFKRTSSRAAAQERAGDIDDRVEAALRALKANASKKIRDDMGPRYGIHVDKSMGVPMAAMQRIAKPLTPDHALAVLRLMIGSTFTDCSL